ncbi:MAG: hypothetical protein C0617_07635 [Desulfuromonas sp.]|uniref:MotE family protein n=1 Tax=Desulfuromonas sp. TaxID=892 RepID=UPI000CA7E268|nr:hypothetical protein [Desulfuromonas sp.]PLX84495.1 MAG: hypothetical protein C0617_07635 [Desulfuromonas sp.]
MMIPRRPIMLGALLVLLCLSPPGAVAVDPPGTGEAGTELGSVEERRLLSSLRQERVRLQAAYEEKEKSLALEREELKSLGAEVDKKLEELQGLHQELRRLLAERDEAQARRIKELAQMYEKMEPQQAAALLEDLEEDLAIGILARLKRKSAGRLLNAMDKEKAGQLSAAYSLTETD